MSDMPEKIFASTERRRYWLSKPHGPKAISYTRTDLVHDPLLVAELIEVLKRHHEHKVFRKWYPKHHQEVMEKLDQLQEEKL